MGKTSNKERWKIQGKTYYKEGETPVTEDMAGIVDEIWNMSNPKGETFKLLIRRGRSNSFALRFNSYLIKRGLYSSASRSTSS